MRTKRLVGAALMAAGMAIGMAAPAIGQTPEQIDQAFLKAIRDKGVPVQDDAAALELAHSTCDVLDGGGSVEDALEHIQDATDWSESESIDFGGLAVYAYCKQHLPE